MKLIIDIDEEDYVFVKRQVADGFINPLKVRIANGIPLDKIKDYIDHIRNTGMGKKKSLEFIEKFIEGLKAESEENDVW